MNFFLSFFFWKIAKEILTGLGLGPEFNRCLGLKSRSSKSFVCNFPKKQNSLYFVYFVLGLVEIIQTLYPWPEREDVGFLLVVGLEWSCGKDSGEGDSHLRMGAYALGHVGMGGLWHCQRGKMLGAHPSVSLVRALCEGLQAGWCHGYREYP